MWLRRTDLDRDLAEGANPNLDPARDLRARQLASHRSRRQLAAGLRWLVRAAHEPARSPWVPVAPLNRRQVLEASDLLLILAARLESTAEPCPRAVALASFLVHDPLSPASLLFEGSERTTATTSQLARDAIEAIDQRPLR